MCCRQIRVIVGGESSQSLGARVLAAVLFLVDQTPVINSGYIFIWFRQLNKKLYDFPILFSFISICYGKISNSFSNLVIEEEKNNHIFI